MHPSAALYCVFPGAFLLTTLLLFYALFSGYPTLSAQPLSGTRLPISPPLFSVARNSASILRV